MPEHANDNATGGRATTWVGRFSLNPMLVSLALLWWPGSHGDSRAMIACSKRGVESELRTLASCSEVFAYMAALALQG